MLNLFGDIYKLRSHWETQSVHKFHATLRKTILNEDWDALLKDNSDNLNIQKWFEMEEKFKGENENTPEDDEDEDYDVKKKKKSRKKKNFNPIWA